MRSAFPISKTPLFRLGRKAVGICKRSTFSATDCIKVKYEILEEYWSVYLLFILTMDVSLLLQVCPRRNLQNTQLAVITGHLKTFSTAPYCFYKNYRFEIRGMAKRAHGNIWSLNITIPLWTFICVFLTAFVRLVIYTEYSHFLQQNHWNFQRALIVCKRYFKL